MTLQQAIDAKEHVRRELCKYIGPLHAMCHLSQICAVAKSVLVCGRAILRVVFLGETLGSGLGGG